MMATTAGAQDSPLTLKDIEAAIEELRGLPPARWLILAPNGKMWVDEDPHKAFASAMASHKFGVELGSAYWRLK